MGFINFPIVTGLYILQVCSVYFAYLSSTTWIVPAVPRLIGNETNIYAPMDEVSWIIAAPDLVFLATTFPLVFLMDATGRKTMLCLTLVPIIILWLVVMFATSAKHLLIGVVVGALSSSIANTVVPLYLVETAPDKIRGTVTSFRHITSSLGQLVTLIVGPYLTIQHFAMVAIVFPVLLLISFIWLPESPYYLLLKNRTADAEASLRKLRDRHDVSEEYEKMNKFVSERSSTNKVRILDMVRTRHIRRCVYISLVLVLARQFCGRAVFDSYSTLIFRLSGSSFLNADNSSMVISAVGLVTAIVIMFVVDYFGRRPLMLLSCVGCAVALIAEGAYFAAPSPSIDWLPLTAHMFFQIAYGIGLDSLPLMTVGEIYPAEFKGIALSFTTVIYALSLFVQGKVFPIAVDAIGVHYVLWIFAIFMIISFFFIYFLVPETKCKSFEEINAEIEMSLKKGKE